MNIYSPTNRPIEMQDMKNCPEETCKGGVGFPSFGKDKYMCMMCNHEFVVEEKTDKTTLDECKNCKNKQLVRDNVQGYIICKKCGIIQDSIISEEQEWNNYTAGVNKSRVGLVDYSNPFATPGSTISTAGNKHFTPYTNKEGKICYMNLYRKLITVNYSSEQKAHDCVANIINQTRVNERVKEIAISYWADMLQSSGYETHRNSIRRGIIFCCIYYAAMSINLPLTRDEISEATGIKSGDMNKGDPIFREMISQTRFKDIINLESDFATMFERCMDNFEFDNKIKFKYAKLCKKICEDYSEFFENRKETTLVSGIMAFVFDEYKLKGVKKIKISEIHGATGVSVPTISSLVKELKKLVTVDYYKL